MTNIAVIGCGVIGITTALEIQKRLGNRGHVTIFADKFSPNTTSDIAAGLWEIYLLADNDENDVLKWSSITYNSLLDLWKEGKAKEAGICFQPIINLFDDEKYHLPTWVPLSVGYNELSTQHLQSLSEQYKKNFTGGFMFMSFTWEAKVFLPYLQDIFLKRDGKMIEKHIDSFNELEEFDVIVNCSGIEARELSKDMTVQPIRGQVFRVDAPWQYITYIVQSNEKDSCYIIPNMNSVVLGGTRQKSFDTRLSTEDSNRILLNTSKLVPSLQKSKIINEIVGLRPSRYKIRLEEEFWKSSKGTVLKIVHNYGHGGAGITLCIGCAMDAADLVENLININRNKI